MRIATQGQSVDSVVSSSIEKSHNIHMTKPVTINKSNEQPTNESPIVQAEEPVVSIEKIHQAVDSLNEFLEINNSTSKFLFHEGLNRYFVQVVNTQTDEVVKEIPPKKLLDAFYEMQKLVGMIVDEKI